MDDIRALLHIAARRLEMSTLLEKLHHAAIVAAAVGLALMIANRIPAEPFVPWGLVAPLLVLGALVAALALWMRSRRTELQVAVLVDERLDLREKLSTALHVQDRDDTFARAAVDDAVRAARDPRHRELAKRRFGIVSPRGWWASPLVVLAALIVSFMPQVDAFSREAAERPDVTEARLEVAESLDAVVQSIRDQPQLSQEIADLLGELTKDSAESRELRSPEELRREAIKRVTDLNERLNEIVSGERGKTSDAMENMLKKLQPPQDGAAREFAEALAAGDFSSAKEALEAMLEKLESGDMTEEQRQQLAEQLEQIAEQLEQLAKQQQELEEALKRAGMDPQLAQNPEALEEAIRNNPELNEQQRQQLADMARAQKAASQMCQGMAGALQQMAQGIQDGQAGEGAGQLGEQLSDLEQLQMLLEQAQLAMNACQGSCQGLGQGLSLQQAMQQWMQAGGAGGAGQNDNIGQRGVAPTPTRTRAERVRTETVDGEIIARMLIDGPQVIGESRITPRDIVAEVVEGFEEGLSEDQLPRKYHEAQKHYFGELERQAQKSDTPAESTSQD